MVIIEERHAGPASASSFRVDNNTVKEMKHIKNFFMTRNDAYGIDRKTSDDSAQ